MFIWKNLEILTCGPTISTLVKFSMGVQLLCFHAVGTRSLAYQPVVRRLKSFIKFNVIVGAAFYYHRLWDISVWSLWPSALIVMQGVYYPFWQCLLLPCRWCFFFNFQCSDKIVMWYGLGYLFWIYLNIILRVLFFFHFCCFFFAYHHIHINATTSFI